MFVFASGTQTSPICFSSNSAMPRESGGTWRIQYLEAQSMGVCFLRSYLISRNSNMFTRLSPNGFIQRKPVYLFRRNNGQSNIIFPSPSQMQHVLPLELARRSVHITRMLEDTTALRISTSNLQHNLASLLDHDVRRPDLHINCVDLVCFHRLDIC